MYLLALLLPSQMPEPTNVGTILEGPAGCGSSHQLTNLATPSGSGHLSCQGRRREEERGEEEGRGRWGKKRKQGRRSSRRPPRSSRDFQRAAPAEVEARSGGRGEVGWGGGEPPESPREDNEGALYVIGLVQGQHPDPFSVAAAARIKVQTNMNLSYLWIHQKRVTFP